MAEVILIEDKDSHQDMIAGLLRDLKYDVRVCSDLAEVSALIPTLTSPPKGILLDLQIPDGNGGQAALETGRDCGLFLRSQTATAKTPIIAYSAYSDDPRVPGWADIIRFAAVFEKHTDSVTSLERMIRQYFV